MDKIVYISIFPLIPQIERYLLIREMIDAGIHVEYWDLKGIYFKGKDFRNVITREYVREIDSFREFNARMNGVDLTKTVFVFQVHLEWPVLSLYFMMNRFRCKTAYFPWVTHERERLITRIIDRINPAEALRTSLNLLAKLCKKAGLIKEYDLVFTAGQLTRDAYTGHRRIVNINYQDYDHYQAAKNNHARIVAGKYCVFLDEGPACNDDVEILNMQRLDFDKFYGSLNRFFDEIERRFNLAVVIAAHPGIDYDSAVFAGREVFKGKTCELVKDAQLVVSQSSTSTSYAVLFRKPVILIYTDEYKIKRKAGFRTLEFLSGSLGLPAYNLDRIENYPPCEIPVPNTVLYDAYKFSCLTSLESEKELSKDIVIRSLKELCA
jgi:hypothetical protein